MLVPQKCCQLLGGHGIAPHHRENLRVFFLLHQLVDLVHVLLRFLQLGPFLLLQSAVTLQFVHGSSFIRARARIRRNVAASKRR